MTPKQLLARIKEKEVQAVDLRFMDLPGLWQHFTIPADALEEWHFEEGLGFDGSSIRGWRSLNQSDMLILPDPATAFLDPFTADPTLTLVCNIQEPLTREDYTRDPRNVARKALNYMRRTGTAYRCDVAADVEFFLFDDVRYEVTPRGSFHTIDSVEGAWNTGRDERPNLGYKLRYTEGYFPCPPSDASHDIRSEVMKLLREMKIGVAAHLHEVATGGQCELDLSPADLVRHADDILKFKYVVKNVAKRHNKTATFMPKPIFGDNGSGMHLHFSLYSEDGRNVLEGSDYAGLSEEGMYAMGGILRHAPALCAITNPTTNSYKRLLHGGEAPINLSYSRRNRTAALRIPVHSPTNPAKRIEFRTPDSSCNPYLAFAAVLMAMLDGMKNKISPGDPLDKDIYDLEPEELKDVAKTPVALEDALRHLEKDHDFLLQGDVFTPDVISTWIWYKREKEVEALRQRPHPYEFALYYDI